MSLFLSQILNIFAKLWIMKTFYRWKFQKDEQKHIHNISTIIMKIGKWTERHCRFLLLSSRKSWHHTGLISVSWLFVTSHLYFDIHSMRCLLTWFCFKLRGILLLFSIFSICMWGFTEIKNPHSTMDPLPSSL